MKKPFILHLISVLTLFFFSACQPAFSQIVPFYTFSQSSGTYNAVTAGADAYLIVRTPSVPLNANPVKQVTCTPGNMLGNGTVPSAGPST